MSDQPVHTDQAVILFDGVCNLCNSSIDFVVRHDKGRYFKFAPLQSSVGSALLKDQNIGSGYLDSIVLVENGKAYVDSSAALRVARKLDGALPLLYGFIIVPPFLRNLVYKFIARNRYRWFGKKNTCRIPTPEERELFLA